MTIPYEKHFRLETNNKKPLPNNYYKTHSMESKAGWTKCDLN